MQCGTTGTRPYQSGGHVKVIGSQEALILLSSPRVLHLKYPRTYFSHTALAGVKEAQYSVADGYVRVAMVIASAGTLLRTRLSYNVSI